MLIGVPVPGEAFPLGGAYPEKVFSADRISLNFGPGLFIQQRPTVFHKGSVQTLIF
jgi:hypothetical protein